MQYGPPEIREFINAGLLANGRGVGEAIDGHRTLTRHPLNPKLFAAEMVAGMPEN